MKSIFFLLFTLILFSGCTSQAIPEPVKPCISAQQLNSYSYEALLNVAVMLKEDKKNIDSFDSFIGAMKLTVNSYTDMIKSSVYISNVVKFLPVPYAGEISNTTKLISKTALSLNGASESLDRYKKSSTYYLESFAKLDPATASTEDLLKLATFADTTLLTDAQDLENSLHKISESTAMMAATTQSISDALDTTGNYLNHVKSLVSFSQDQAVSGVDKRTVTQNKSSITTKMLQLNQKIAALEHTAQSYHESIVKAHIYSNLSMSLNTLK
jgi:hypothetical protein